MKNTTHLIAILGCLLIPSWYSPSIQALVKASKQQRANELILESPRLRQLKAEVAGGDRSALNRFWEAMATEHTPLLEPIPDQPGKVLVSFLWRAAPRTTGVMVVGQQMTRLLETDLWFTTQIMDPTIPIFYSFLPSVTGEAEVRSPDPLNQHRFVMPAEEQAAIPSDLQAEHAQWSRTPMLLFRENPAAHWTEVQPGIPRGKVEMFTVRDKGSRNRRVWVYAPPNYNAKSTTPYRLLICFDGSSYLSEIPVPTILNNLLAAEKIWPTVAVMIDNGDARASAEDLDNHAAFADFMGTELMPWVRKNWTVSTDPGQTILCGYSRGGLGAAFVAWRYPAMFGNVLTQSGAFWRGNEGGTSDLEWLTQQFNDSPKVNIRFYIEVGAQETGKTPQGQSSSKPTGVSARSWKREDTTCVI